MTRTKFTVRERRNHSTLRRDRSFQQPTINNNHETREILATNYDTIVHIALPDPDPCSTESTTASLSRRLVREPPEQAQRRQQQHREANGLVQLEGGDRTSLGGVFVDRVLHPPADHQVGQDRGRDRPVQDDRDRSVTLLVRVHARLTAGRTRLRR